MTRGEDPVGADHFDQSHPFQAPVLSLLNTSQGQNDPISWKWYAEGWDQAITSGGNSAFIPHHQPYAYR